MKRKEEPTEQEVRSFRWGLNIGMIMGFLAGIGFTVLMRGCGG